jgi:hypothetical protein
MKKLLLTVSILALATPALATPGLIVNPGEVMVTVPGLEFLGASRLSTVQFCSNEVGVDNYRELATDSEFEGMESCLIEHT